MKLILQKDVKNLGKAGDQILVKAGYARNFLIPKGQALPINQNRLKVWKHQKVIIEAKKRKAVAERKALIEKLSSIKLKFEKESLKDGRLFGSVTAHEISQALEQLHKISVDKRDISVAVLKTAGDHKVNIRLDSEHQTDMLVSIKGKVTKKREQEGDTGSLESEKTEEQTKDKPSLLQKAKMAFSSKSKKTDEENQQEDSQETTDKTEEQTDQPEEIKKETT